MLKLDIRVFKGTGKFYASSEIEQEEDIPIFDDRFKRLIKENLPATLTDGTVVVTDKADGDGFHTILYHMEDIV